MIGVTTGSPEALSIEESKTSTLPAVTFTCSVASSGIVVVGKRSCTLGCVQPHAPSVPDADATVTPAAFFSVRLQAAPSGPAAKPVFVRNDPFCRIPVTTAPASADVRNERSGDGLLLGAVRARIRARGVHVARPAEDRDGRVRREAQRPGGTDRKTEERLEDVHDVRGSAPRAR